MNKVYSVHGGNTIFLSRSKTIFKQLEAFSPTQSTDTTFYIIG